MKITYISFSDLRGGAAKAASNQINAIRSAYPNILIDHLVAEKISTSPLISGPSKLEFFNHFILRIISFIISKLQKTNNLSKTSLNLFSSHHIVKNIDMNSDIIHFHWINNDTISMKKLKELLSDFKGLIIFTLHDDWFFCGSEHYSINDNRYITGYNPYNKSGVGINLQMYTFNRKKNLQHLLNKPNIIFTAPSQWMVKRAKSSLILKKSNIVYIPNVIDNEAFSPKYRDKCIERFGLDGKKKIIAFGAVNGTKNYLKGYDLLIDALHLLKNKNHTQDDIELLIFGGAQKSISNINGFRSINVGKISNIEEMASIYSSADIVVVPSRMESFGQVAAESLSCGTPVIAFDNSGVSEVINHALSNFSVSAFDTEDLSKKIHSFLSKSKHERRKLSIQCRKSIISNYSPDRIAHLLNEIYNNKNY